MLLQRLLKAIMHMSYSSANDLNQKQNSSYYLYHPSEDIVHQI